MESFQHIVVSVADGIATVTLNRPDSLNAFTTVMENELIAAFDRIDADDEIQAVVLTGAGRGFCAGMDLAEGEQTFDQWSGPGQVAASRYRRDGGGRVTLRMFDLKKPIVAAINGPAVGVGITMTLAADIRLSVPGAKIGFVFARRGLVPESCSSWFLPRLVPMPVALDWVLTGRVFLAEEALESGLFTSLHEKDQLLDAAYATARGFTEATAPVSRALARQMVWRMAGAPHPMIAHAIETRALNLRGASADAREGITAFLERRPAKFPQCVSQDTPELFDLFSAPAYEDAVRGSAPGDAAGDRKGTER
ncbi:crotonase/enoyl-CoA hydratase family protein [Streptomyces sp. NPDC005708]|uniref:crotonase/enoyl-CoA hydratase family protein n=1 Tax=Streptomyces sp. NPDC005708 TaxID=3154564 RepID=UPI0033CA9175